MKFKNKRVTTDLIIEIIGHDGWFFGTEYTQKIKGKKSKIFAELNTSANNIYKLLDCLPNLEYHYGVVRHKYAHELNRKAIVVRVE